MSNPLVSIACVTYNHEPFIRQCLEGFIMQQTDFDFEVVIHDDASTDGTKDVILEYCLKYPNLFRPIFQEQNRYIEGKGIFARFVFPECRGKYIAMCEGDDYWTDPLKLQKQVSLLENNLNYSCSFHICNVVDSFGNVLIENYPQCYKFEDSLISLENLILGSAIPQTLSVVFRATVIPMLPLSCRITDIILFYYLLKMGNAICVAENMGVYRNHSAGEWSGMSYTQKIISTIKCRLDIYEADGTDLSALFVMLMFNTYPRSLYVKELSLTIRIFQIIYKYLGLWKTLLLIFNKAIFNRFPSGETLRNLIMY